MNGKSGQSRRSDFEAAERAGAASEDASKVREELTPGTNNMGVSISHDGDPQIIESGGLDTVVVGIYGVFRNAQKTFAWASAGQQAAREAQSGEHIEGSHIVHSPSGCRAFGKWRPWRIEFKGITFVLSEDENTIQTAAPGLQAQIKSRELLLYGYGECINIVEQFLRLIDFEPSSTSVSRVDLCVDLLCSMGEFKNAFLGEQVVCKARQGAIYFQNAKRKKFLTLQYGVSGAAIKCRIYDKLAETKKDEVKRELMRVRRWGGKIPKHATRVEFQISGKVLRKRFCVTTLEQLEKELPQIAKYATSEWLRITEKVNDQEHYERLGVAAIWQRVQRAFEEWCGKSVRARLKKMEIVPKCEKLVAQAFGCLRKVYAVMGQMPEAAEDFAADVLNAAKPHWHFFTADVIRKRQALTARVGDLCYSPSGLEYPQVDL
ncbi:MAG: hypothetical protein ACF8CY_06770 [Gimesia chilikensis]